MPPQLRKMWKRYLSRALWAAPVVMGCATVAPPRDRLAVAERAIESASELGAEQLPAAAMHLQLAHDEMNEAQRLIDGEQCDRADLILQRATVDAELAWALAMEAPVRAEARAAEDRLQLFKQQHVQ